MADTTGAAVAARWDANADRWTNDVRAGYDAYRDHFTLPAFHEFLPPISGRRVIDLGCGEGSNTRRFARLGASMTGVDLSERMIAHAKAAEAADPLGITYLTASFSDLSAFADASFDVALSTLALMDGPDLDGAMREASRVLKPGGLLAFSVLHPCSITPSMRWERDPNGATTGLTTARYFDRTPFTETWRFGDRPSDEDTTPFSVPRFPRTLSDYLNAVTGAGLRIVRVAEPQPSEDACRAVPRFRRWRNIAPFLLMVLAERT